MWTFPRPAHYCLTCVARVVLRAHKVAAKEEYFRLTTTSNPYDRLVFPHNLSRRFHVDRVHVRRTPDPKSICVSFCLPVCPSCLFALVATCACPLFTYVHQHMTLSELGLQGGEKVMVETRLLDGSWPRHRYIEDPGFRLFREGARVDAMDYQGRWFRGEVRVAILQVGKLPSGFHPSFSNAHVPDSATDAQVSSTAVLQRGALNRSFCPRVRSGRTVEFPGRVPNVSLLLHVFMMLSTGCGGAAQE